MSEKVNIPSLQRITFFTGQRMTATDLAALQKVNRELRWLHNRGLHGWGIALGLDITGEKGDSEVKIGPGYGVDCLGREILLTESWTKSVPAVAAEHDGTAATYYLVAAYQSDEEQKVAERRPGVCLPEGTVRLNEEPLIDWRRPDQLRNGLDLILAKASIRNCRLSRSVSLAARRHARPSKEPYIAAGQTVAGKTSWESWKRGNQSVGLQTVVDTSAARFHKTPHYVAHVAGNRFHEQEELMAVGFPAVIEATPMKFTLQMLLPEMGQDDQNPARLRQDPDIAKTKLGWHVIWMGIEG